MSKQSFCLFVSSHTHTQMRLYYLGSSSWENRRLMFSVKLSRQMQWCSTAHVPTLPCSVQGIIISIVMRVLMMKPFAESLKEKRLLACPMPSSHFSICCWPSLIHIRSHTLNQPVWDPLKHICWMFPCVSNLLSITSPVRLTTFPWSCFCCLWHHSPFHRWSCLTDSYTRCLWLRHWPSQPSFSPLFLPPGSRLLRGLRKVSGYIINQV